MANGVHWLGDTTESSVKVCFWGDTTGTYVLNCNGQTANIAIDTGVELTRWRQYQNKNSLVRII